MPRRRKDHRLLGAEYLCLYIYHSIIHNLNSIRQLMIGSRAGVCASVAVTRAEVSREVSTPERVCTTRPFFFFPCSFSYSVKIYGCCGRKLRR